MLKIHSHHIIRGTQVVAATAPLPQQSMHTIILKQGTSTKVDYYSKTTEVVAMAMMQ